MPEVPGFAYSASVFTLHSRLVRGCNFPVEQIYRTEHDQSSFLVRLCVLILTRRLGHPNSSTYSLLLASTTMRAWSVGFYNNNFETLKRIIIKYRLQVPANQSFGGGDDGGKWRKRFLKVTCTRSSFGKR